MKRIFRLQRSATAEPSLNLRWTQLLDLIELSNDELDCVAELRPGDSFITTDGYTVKRQDS